MNIVIDMNLSPKWASFFSSHGHQAVHWSTVGAPNAPDSAIMDWAVTHKSIVFTNDLDFGTLLVFSGMSEPSVIQVRMQDVRLSSLGPLILAALQQYETLLLQGALITIDESRTKSRILPLNNKK